jgi:hypothetical protein
MGVFRVMRILDYFSISKQACLDVCISVSGHSEAKYVSTL